MKMKKKVLIDIMKLRELESCTNEAIDPELLRGKTFKTIREFASFWYTCRHCEDPPCVNVCPADALNKDKNDMINRALNLCIRCKTCITACPFGTLMPNLFATKTDGYKYFDLGDESDLVKFAESFDHDAVAVVEMDEKPEEHIYKLSEHVLIKERKWASETE